jgi:N-acetylglucosamine-6-sulfatase
MFSDSSAASKYKNFTLIENGVSRLYPWDVVNLEQNYVTDVLGMGLDGDESYPRKMGEFLDTVQAGERFFVTWCPNAPHDPATTAPRHRTTFAGSDGLLPRSPALNVIQTNAPAWVQALPVLTHAQEKGQGNHERTAEHCTLALDDQANRILNEICSRFPNTLTIFIADQGIARGEHRIRDSKTDPYDPSLRAVLAIRWPNGMGGRVTRLISNLDICPTICKAAGITPGRVLNGTPIQTSARQSLPMSWVGSSPTDPTYVPPYVGVRTTGAKYIGYPAYVLAGASIAPEEELFDLQKDPYELNNVASNPASGVLRADMIARL